jgi:hypothetical protein
MTRKLASQGQAKWVNVPSVFDGGIMQDEDFLAGFTSQMATKTRSQTENLNFLTL